MQKEVIVPSQADFKNLLAGGDPVAFERLFRKNRSNVYKAAYAILKCREDAQEALQEIFLKAWVIRARFETVKCPEQYLYAMARNQAMTLLQRRKREMQFLMTELREIGLSPSPHSIIESEELEAAYRQTLARLTERQRLIFKMIREENMSHGAIAQKLDISPNTVNNHMKAALIAFRNLIREQERPGARCDLQVPRISQS